MHFSERTLLQRYPFTHEEPVLCDVGAHHGGTSQPFAARGWRIIGFEPERENFAVLKQKLSQLSNVTLINKAVTNVDGQSVPFYVSDTHFGIHTLRPFHESHKVAYKVQTVRLDTILHQLRVSIVTMLKIDIEGADFLALQGFDFQQYRPELIMVEFMDERSQQNFGYTHHDMVAYMRDHDYIAYVSEWAPIKEYAHQGMVGDPHVWRQCVRYPIDHEPAWGNLLFVPERDLNKFELTLRDYLRFLQRPTSKLRQFFLNTPGFKRIYCTMKEKLC